MNSMEFNLLCESTIIVIKKTHYKNNGHTVNAVQTRLIGQICITDVESYVHNMEHAVKINSKISDESFAKG